MFEIRPANEPTAGCSLRMNKFAVSCLFFCFELALNTKIHIFNCIVVVTALAVMRCARMTSWTDDTRVKLAVKVNKMQRCMNCMQDGPMKSDKMDR